MTRYDEADATDGDGGPHPLACVPQEVLDAAREALAETVQLGRFTEGDHLVLDADPTDTEPLAPISDSVVIAVLAAIKATTGKHPYQPSTTIRLGQESRERKQPPG